MPVVEWARVFGIPVTLGVLFGLAGGWLWWKWWGPPLDGKIFETGDGERLWLPDPIDPGLPHQFGATGMYVVLAVGFGLLIGLITGWICRNRALLGLVAVMLAGVVGAVVMTLVGESQSPPDPQEKAESVEVGTELPEQMALTKAEIDLSKGFAEFVNDNDRTFYLPTAQMMWPGAALIGYMILMLALPVRDPDDEIGLGVAQTSTERGPEMEESAEMA